MTADRQSRRPELTIVNGASSLETGASDGREGIDETDGIAARDVDWSILMARAQGGDASSYRRLLKEIIPYLRCLAARVHRDAGDIEDAVQDILLILHTVRRTYDPRRPFAPWLVAIANRRLIDRLRRQGRTRARETALTPEHESAIAADPEFWQSADRLALAGAIKKLPPGQRRAITLLKLEELSLKEAASASGMSVGALKVATHRAVRNLWKMLSDRSRS